MKTANKDPGFSQEKKIEPSPLTQQEELELLCESELLEIEEFFSREFDEMELRFQEHD